MKLVGQYLKEARIRKKLTLEKISQDLKISQDFLVEVEKDQFPDYIDSVFLIGHIRSYSNYLSLDSNLIINNFKVQISFNKNENINRIKKPIESIKLFSYPQLASLVAIIFIGINFYFLFIKSNNLEPKYAMTPNIPENLEAIIEGAQMQISLEEMKRKKANEDNTKLSKSLEEQEKKIFSSSSVVASISNEADLKALNEIITLKFLNSTWIQLRSSEDKIIISKLMNKGEEYSYNLSDNFNLTAGNAGNIVIFYEGAAKGKVGRAGEVIESLIIDNKFNN